MQYIICRATKLKTWGQIEGAGSHQSRKRPTPNAAPHGTAPLFLIGSGNPARDVRLRIEQSGVEVRKNQVLSIEILLTASPEYYRPNQPAKAGASSKRRLEAFIARALPWLKDYFDPANVVSVALHLDESTPHLHAVIVPVDTTPRMRGPTVRLNCKRWLGGREKCSALQDSVGRAMAPLGLQRGIRGSKAKHSTIRAWYGALRAPLDQRVEVPLIEPPPAMVRQSSREAWSEAESERILKDLQRQLAPVLTRAKASDLVAKKRAEMEATARVLAKRLAEVELERQELAIRTQEALEAIERTQGVEEYANQLEKENAALRHEIESLRRDLPASPSHA